MKYGAAGPRLQAGIGRCERTDQLSPASLETENETALAVPLPSDEATTPALPTNRGRSEMRGAGARTVTRAQRRPPSCVAKTRPTQPAIHPAERETNSIGARHGSPDWNEATRVQVRPPSVVRRSSPCGPFGLTGSIQPWLGSTKLR